MPLVPDYYEHLVLVLNVSKISKEMFTLSLYFNKKYTAFVSVKKNKTKHFINFLCEGKKSSFTSDEKKPTEIST